MHSKCIFITFYVFTIKVLAEKCTTPNNEEAECISLYLCPAIIQALAIHECRSIEFVRKSNCGGTAVDPMVCCGSLSNFSENVTLISKLQRKPLLSDRRYCGRQHTDDYFRDQNGTALHEFPWIALLIYKRGKKLCTGSLINNRYILTAHSCFDKDNEISSVRLGEYNVAADKDRIKSSKYEECSDPVEEFGIEKIILHSRFAEKPVVRNDIALIRLDREVTYSDYIRPICLPIPGTQFAKMGDILTSTGWGTVESDAYVYCKKRVLTELMTSDECLLYVEEPYITEDQLCTWQLEDTDDSACTAADIGAPLMFSAKNQWHQEGITADAGDCSRCAVLFTKVVNYLDWIEESIQL